MKRDASSNPNFNSSFHPALPFIENAEKKYSPVYSDHIPFKVTLQFEGGSPITLVSWNVLEDDASKEGAYGENEEERVARHGRIIESLKKIVKKHNPDFICLQGMNIKEEKTLGPLYTKIETALKSHYSDKREKMGKLIYVEDRIIFYNILQFTNKYSDDGNAFLFEEIGTIGRFFRLKNMNMRDDFLMIPVNNEKTIQDFLSYESTQETVSIIIGNFNSNIAPIYDTNLKNIVTSVKSPLHRDWQSQRAYATDGCFYSKNNKMIHQAEMMPLNPITGESFSSQELVPLDTSQVMLAKIRDEILEPRLLICVDDYYRTKPLINEKTISEYQKFLENQLGHNKYIVVRPTRTIHNVPGIGIALPRAFANEFLCFDSRYQSLFQCIIPGKARQEDRYVIITATQNKIDSLVRAMEEFIEWHVKKHNPPQQKKKNGVFPFFSNNSFEQKEPISIRDSDLLFYTYQQEDQTIDLKINMRYQYTYGDIQQIWEPRLKQLNRWLNENDKFSEVSVSLPKQEITFDRITEGLVDFLRKITVEKQQLFFIPIQKENKWSTLIISYNKQDTIDVSVYRIGPLGLEEQVLRGAIWSAYSLDRSTSVPFYSHDYYIDANSTDFSSGVLAIENAIQIMKHLYFPNRFLLKPTWCDATMVATLRGEQLRMIGGPESTLFHTQFTGNAKKEDLVLAPSIF